MDIALKLCNLYGPFNAASIQTGIIDYLDTFPAGIPWTQAFVDNLPRQPPQLLAVLPTTKAELSCLYWSFLESVIYTNPDAHQLHTEASTQLGQPAAILPMHEKIGDCLHVSEALSRMLTRRGVQNVQLIGCKIGNLQNPVSHQAVCVPCHSQGTGTVGYLLLDPTLFLPEPLLVSNKVTAQCLDELYHSRCRLKHSVDVGPYLHMWRQSVGTQRTEEFFFFPVQGRPVIPAEEVKLAAGVDVKMNVKLFDVNATMLSYNLKTQRDAFLFLGQPPPATQAAISLVAMQNKMGNARFGAFQSLMQPVVALSNG